MFILEVSVGVSVRFYIGRLVLFIFLDSFYVVYVVVVELELAGGASRRRGRCRRATTAFDLWFCVRAGGRTASAAPRRSLAHTPATHTHTRHSPSARPRRPAASLHADKAFLVVLERHLLDSNP